MTLADLPVQVRQFLFDVIDSAEQLDVLVMLKTTPEKWYSPNDISLELRSSRSAIQGRLDLLSAWRLVEKNPEDPQLYRYSSPDPQTDALIQQVMECYKVRKQSVLQVIFSPLKKGRTFADAFVVVKNPKGSGD